MNVDRRVHSTAAQHRYVRFHVVGADGACVPEACAGPRSGCQGYHRRYQAVDAARRLRGEHAAARAAGERW